MLDSSLGRASGYDTREPKPRSSAWAGFQFISVSSGSVCIHRAGANRSVGTGLGFGRLSLIINRLDTSISAIHGIRRKSDWGAEIHCGR